MRAMSIRYDIWYNYRDTSMWLGSDRMEFLRSIELKYSAWLWFKGCLGNLFLLSDVCLFGDDSIRRKLAEWNIRKIRFLWHQAKLTRGFKIICTYTIYILSPNTILKPTYQKLFESRKEIKKLQIINTPQRRS